jgi:hypothetical protein
MKNATYRSRIERMPASDSTKSVTKNENHYCRFDRLSGRDRMKVIRQVGAITLMWGFSPNSFGDHAVIWKDANGTIVHVLDWSSEMTSTAFVDDKNPSAEMIQFKENMKRAGPEVDATSVH